MMARFFRKAGNRAYLFLVCLLVFAINRLPDRIILGIRTGTPITMKMDYPRCNIFLDIGSDLEYHIRRHSCKKEPETIEWIERSFREGDVFYDVGANVGAYSLVASKYLDGKIQVYAFEPGFTTFPQLCKNIIVNDSQDSIIPVQIALSDQTAIGVFNYSNLTPGGALHALGAPLDYKGAGFQPVYQQRVLSYRIDDLIQQFCLPVPNHIKIDVDGAEYNVLKGAEKTVANPAVNSVIVELAEGTEEAARIIEFLSQKGLNFLSKHKYVYGGEGSPFSMSYNYIFQRTDHR